MQYTKEQQLAINTKDKDILVSAAAGSGKTAILVERIVQMIIDVNNPATIDSVLIVTFTKAATAEMKKRIASSISKALAMDPKNKYLRNQLAMINKASISTIDAFFNTVVKKYYKIIEIDPNYRIGDRAELSILSNQILDEYIDELYEKNDKDFLEFVDTYAVGNDDSALKELITDIYDKMANVANPKKWLEDCAERFNIETKEQYYKSDSFKFIKNNIQKCLDNYSLYLESSRKLYNKYGIEIHNYFLEDTMFYDELKTLFDNEMYDELVEKLGEKYPTAKIKDCLKQATDLDDFIKEALEKELKIYREIYKKSYTEIKNYFEAKAEDYISEYKYLYKITKTLTNIVAEFSERFMELKKEKAIFDFSDITRFCYNILINEDGSPTSIAREYQNKFNQIIVDEYQDSNFLQDSILSTISRKELGEPNMFMVGDLKQSIYMFRNAEPTMFKNKYKKFASATDDSAIKIDLNKNFRSRKCVIDCINFIFKQIMSETVGDVEYDKDNMLYLGANYPEPKDKDIKYSDCCEFYVIDNSQIVVDDEKASESFKRSMEEINNFKNGELEGGLISNRINELINKEKLNVYDKDIDDYRLAQYRDFVVLVSSVQEADEYISILHQNGIPAICSKKFNLYGTAEVHTILALLAVIDNPFLDIELLTVLHSPIYSLTADELTEIRCYDKEAYFYSALKKYAQGEENNISLKNKADKIIKDIEKWSALSRDITISELLYLIYNQTDYYTYVGLLKNGENRQANLNVLCEKANAFEKLGFNGLFRFITYVEKLMKNDDDEQKNIVAQLGNVVQIMTIHASKGLEFPVVFVSRLGSKFISAKAKSNFLIDSDAGIVPNFTKLISAEELKENDSKIFEKVMPRVSRDSQYANLVRDKINKEELSERMRVLYVAFTRAKEKLILVGCSGNYNASSLCKGLIYEEEKITPSILNYSFLKMLILAMSRHPDNNCEEIAYNDSFGLSDNIFISEQSRFIIKVIDRKDINIDQTDNDKKLLDCFEELGKIDKDKEYSKHKAEIYRRLDFDYSYKEDITTPSTVSISDIKKSKLIEIENNRVENQAFNEDNQGIEIIEPEENNQEDINISDFPMPDFYSEEKEINLGAFKGTATHTVMEHLDFNIQSLDELTALMDSLKKDNIITQEEYNAVDKNKIMKFLASELCQRIKKSDRVYREAPFAMGMPANRVYKDKSTETTVIVHGIIDLYFIEDNKIILVDYKTDNTTSVKEIKNRYQIQLDLYKEVLEKNMGLEVAEKIIYLFKADKTILL